ncbi:hypothetical protein HYW43_00770 [Candidatus Daviesbacteria bacterium]|nr:hypothetical protein [Candidatus Daviesbacteria bacterium]
MSERYSRREFLEKAGKLAVVLGIAPEILSACGPTKVNEPRFFDEIKNLPLSEQLRRVDQLYSTTPLSKEAAVNYVTPLWVGAYTQFSGSGLSQDKILSNLALTYDISQRKATVQEPGKVVVNPVTKTVGKIEFNFGSFESNKSIKHPEVNQSAPGIVYLRSGFAHEIGHFDTTMKEDRALGKVINDNSIVTPKIDYPDLLVLNAFTFTGINPDQSYTVFFDRFDEMATDVVSSYIASRENLPVIMIYPRASYLRDMLDWVKFSSDNYLAMHRNSDLPAFALELGRISQGMNKTTQNQDQALIDGLRIIRIFNSGNLLQLTPYYPGIKEEILDKPVRLVR